MLGDCMRCNFPQYADFWPMSTQSLLHYYMSTQYCGSVHSFHFDLNNKPITQLKSCDRTLHTCDAIW